MSETPLEKARRLTAPNNDEILVSPSQWRALVRDLLALIDNMNNEGDGHGGDRGPRF